LASIGRTMRGCQLDASQTRTAIRMQEERRGITVPATLTAPGAPWGANNYRVSAQNSSLPPALHELDDALAAARTFLGTPAHRQHYGGAVEPSRAGLGVSGPWTRSLTVRL